MNPNKSKIEKETFVDTKISKISKINQMNEEHFSSELPIYYKFEIEETRTQECIRCYGVCQFVNELDNITKPTLKRNENIDSEYTNVFKNRTDNNILSLLNMLSQKNNLFKKHNK